ncbi:hypothetical protein A4A49_39442 [Nicotiana attenuata]|uniref:Retrotransposon gag domain-containing protein n=1 Tax=Nicotiana attenuata TaxID=49451 RepID=A0A1J6K4S5_NICAT|nr:hypothetical protein A4A49_39442 [Nicotiana attenuata]
MSTEMNEIMNMMQKMSTEMSRFVARQNQLEANHEQVCRGQEEALNEIREVLNEVIHGGKRPERDKNPNHGEELYSPNDKPFEFGELATPSTTGINTLLGLSGVGMSSTLPPINKPIQTSTHLQIAGPNHPSLGSIPHRPSLPTQPAQPFNVQSTQSNYSTHLRVNQISPQPYIGPPELTRSAYPYQTQPPGQINQHPIPPHLSNHQVHYPPAYNFPNTHMPPSLYHQLPYVPQPPTTPLYQTTPTNPNQQQAHNSHNVPLPRLPFTKYSKVEFPKFDGEDLRTWLYKVDQFFVDEEVTIQQRMKWVSLHFEGDTLQWHLGYMRSRGQLPLPSWDEYIWALCDSFGAEYSDPMTEIIGIKHTGSVKDYQKAFVGVMTRLDISVEHAISIFLHNLKPELSHAVKVGNPCTLPQAYYLARLHEASFAAQSKAIKAASAGSSWPRGQASGNLQKNNNFVPRRPTTAKFDNTKRRRLTPVEMEEKRAQGLCFFCDEKYVAGHKCQAKRQLFSLELEESVALNGTMGYQTLRLRGFTEHQPLEVFIDCGSTHNFIDEHVARRLGCKITKIKPQLVQVADGRELPTDSICKGLQWLMQGAVFQDDFLVFPIGKSDIVLGIQWLCSLNDIKFNFKKLLMEFEYQGRMLTLKGIQPNFKTVKAKCIEKMVVGGAQLFMVKVREAESNIQELKEDQDEEQDPEVITVLERYADVFGEPTQLPPSRGVFDHHIPLLEGKENKVADALSRLPMIEMAAMTLSTMKTNLLDLIIKSWEKDAELKSVIQTLKEKGGEVDKYTFIQDQLRKKGRLVVGPDQQLRKDIIKLWHDAPAGGHSGRENTYRRLSTLFWWKNMREEVQQHVKA